MKELAVKRVFDTAWFVRVYSVDGNRYDFGSFCYINSKEGNEQRTTLEFKSENEIFDYVKNMRCD